MSGRKRVYGLYGTCLDIFETQNTIISTSTLWTTPTWNTLYGFHATLLTTPPIIAISVTAFAIGDPGYYYYPSYYLPNKPYKQGHPLDRNDQSGGAKINLLELNEA